MRVLGLDISQTSTGWAILSDGSVGISKPIANPAIQVIDHGYLDFNPKVRLSDNLYMFHGYLATIINKYWPLDTIVIEDTFFGKNPKTAKLLDQYGAAAILTCREACMKIGHDTRMLRVYVATHRSAISPFVKAFLASKGLKPKKKMVDKDECYLYISSSYGLKNVRNDETDAISIASFPFLREAESQWVI